MTAVTFTSALKYNKFMGPAPGATSFPQVILTAATFNVSLFEAIGRVIFFSFFFTAQGVHLQKKEKGACAGALFIMSGETETGELHLGKFKWGHAFLSLNSIKHPYSPFCWNSSGVSESLVVVVVVTNALGRAGHFQI
ncbi:uncharacterized protein [Henckelia pumila]|uniref:uncharacterized protein isoform X1 n=1 Tax=Henckelia pumila TaxID=405737 RepID=UPI003C6E6EDE